MTLWGFRGVEVLNGMHTQLGIISIPLSIDLVGTGSKSSNEVHHGNFLFACYISSSRVIFLCYPSSPNATPRPLILSHLTIHSLKYLSS